MLKTKALIRLTFLTAAVTWLVMAFGHFAILFSHLSDVPPGVPRWLPGVMMDLYIISLFYYYKFKVERDESLNFSDLLWKVFATGLVVTVISLVLRMIPDPSPDKKIYYAIFNDIIYQFNIGLFLSFLIAAYTSWKRLIYYQKSKWVIRSWAVFEFSLLIVLVSDTIAINLYRPTPMVILILMALMLSVNMKWVAYLNFKQKWTSLLLLLLTIFYLTYFFYTLVSVGQRIAEGPDPKFVLFTGHDFEIALFIFVAMYSVFSFLVIMFNLPTSSVFEQKLEEVVNFQRISQSIQTEQNEESVYNILLESSVRSVFADAAWLEIEGASRESEIYTYHMEVTEAAAIRDHLTNSNIKGILDQGSDKTKNMAKHLASLKGYRFRSILAFPIQVKGETIGTLALLKELPEGFNKEMTRIVSAFANQAGISIENFRLMEEAFQNERYKEELKIAKNVQKSLLPDKLDQDADFEIAAFSESADEVGGDYYDTLRINDHQVALIVADVSGKGTTAAFHMSQMKGIFHSLAQQELDPKEFMVRANQALIYCLERGSFISASYFVIDTTLKKILYARAGHCPVLYFFAGTNTSGYLKDKGKALGMIKSRDYCNHIETNELSYNSNDIMVLYTDGITEAKDKKGDEFGLERLQDTLGQFTEKMPKDIVSGLMNSLYSFSGTTEINDDYTVMIVKFH